MPGLPRQGLKNERFSLPRWPGFWVHVPRRNHPTQLVRANFSLHRQREVVLFLHGKQGSIHLSVRIERSVE